MAAMTIAELEETLDDNDGENIVTGLGELEVSDDASYLSIGSDRYLLDEMAEATLGRHLKIPKPYLKACDPEFKAVTLNHWLQAADESSVGIEIINGHVVSVHDPNTVLIPVRDIARVAGRVFAPEDKVETMLRDETLFHLDITSDHYSIEVPNPDRIPGRPEAGDITHGGIRFLAHPNDLKPPSVMGYWHRLVCGNGMSTPVKLGQVHIKGHTLEEVLQEMEHAANAQLAINDERMAQYVASSRYGFPGTAQAFAFALASESKLSAGVIKKVMDIVNQLPEEASVYDVTQAFTSVANNDVNHTTMLALQQLGGKMSFHTEKVIQRCGACERALPTA